MDTLKGQIAYHNDGMRASYRASNHSFNLLARNGVKIEGNTVTQNGAPSVLALIPPAWRQRET